MSQSRPGYRRSANGLIGALVAVLLAIAFVWGLSWFQHRGTPNPAPTVSYASSLAAARQDAAFKVLAPQPKPPWWRCTSVRFSKRGSIADWHLGGLTSDGQYIGLEQSSGSAGAFVARVTPATIAQGNVTIAGDRWRRLTSGQGETALVRTSRADTTVVTGTAGLGDLTAFARLLK